jgi:hypothetical protein
MAQSIVGFTVLCHRFNTFKKNVALLFGTLLNVVAPVYHFRNCITTLLDFVELIHLTN